MMLEKNKGESDMLCGNSKATGELRYATSFEVKLLGAKCDVEVVVDLGRQDASAIVSMRQILSSSPAFRATREDLSALSACIQKARESAGLLDATAEGAQANQLNCSCGGAVLIVVKPPGKPARYALNVGLFHREGLLEELTSKEIDEAVEQVDALIARVLSKIKSLTKI
jgi:hypothetical protein